MVFGFLVTAALIIMLVFALKTRQKIQNYGKSNILWKKVKVIDEVEPPRDVEAWVSDIKSTPCPGVSMYSLGFSCDVLEKPFHYVMLF